ncbi:MAG: rod shape-determining protein MreD [Gaiellales bacterium]
MSAADVFEHEELLEDDDTGEQPRPPRASPAAVAAPAVGLLVAVYLEIALAIDARVLGAVPDLALIVIVGIALRFGPVWGSVAGFVAGLLIDVAVQGPFGASALVLTPVGWAAGAWAERRRRVSLGMAIAVLLVATAVALVGDALVAVGIAGEEVAWSDAFLHGVAEIAITVLIGIPVLALLRRICGVPEGGRA